MTAAFLILGFIILLHLGVSAWVECMDNIQPEYEQCHGCPCGWCDCEPGDEECMKWRKENETRLDD